MYIMWPFDGVNINPSKNNLINFGISSLDNATTKYFSTVPSGFREEGFQTCSYFGGRINHSSAWNLFLLQLLNMQRTVLWSFIIVCQAFKEEYGFKKCWRHTTDDE